MRVLLPVASIATAFLLGGCVPAQLRLPEGISTHATTYAVSGLSPRRHGEPVRFGPYSALEMREGDRFGWAIPLDGAALVTLRKTWAFTQIALQQPPVQVQCRARTLSAQRGDGDAVTEIDLSGLAGPVLACGFRTDRDDMHTLHVTWQGRHLEGTLSGMAGDYRVRSLHGYAGSPLTSAWPTGYQIVSNGRPVVIIDRLNGGQVVMEPGLAEVERIQLASVASALLLFDASMGEG